MINLVFACMITIITLPLLPILFNCYTKRFVTGISNLACAISLLQTALFFASGLDSATLDLNYPVSFYILSVTLTATSDTILTMLITTFIIRVIVYFMYR